MNRAFYAARNVAIANWEGLRQGTRTRLLIAVGLSTRFAELPWMRLPESVQNALIESAMNGDRLVAR